MVGGVVWVRRRQGQRGVAEVDAGAHRVDPGRHGGVDGQVRGGDPELVAVRQPPD